MAPVPAQGATAATPRAPTTPPEKDGKKYVFFARKDLEERVQSRTVGDRT